MHITDIINGLAVQFGSQDTAGLIGSPIDRTTDSSAISDWSDKSRVEPTQTGPLLDSSDYIGDDHVDDAVLQISGAGHWFLEGWIGDHSVEFLVDSGPSVTAMSRFFVSDCWNTGGDIGMHLKEHYVVLMGLVSGCLDALTVWYRSWDC